MSHGAPETMIMPAAQPFASYVDRKRGLVDRRIFSDGDIYQAELENIYARAWLFMCHDSQISNPGDFFLNFMGEDRVIVARDNDGLPQVLVNSCRHRGNAVCRAEEGHATSFMCTYHGWTYDLKGNLVGVPGFKEVYHEELNREGWGLIRAANVENYRGFIFATMDPEAPSLRDYLGGGGRLALDLLADPGNLVAVSGVQKYVINANWKFPMDNVPDFYHGGLTHASATMAGLNWTGAKHSKRKPGRLAGSLAVKQSSGYSVVSEYGHIAAVTLLPEGGAAKLLGNPLEQWRFESQGKTGPRVQAKAAMSAIFPNMFITMRMRQIGLRLPKGPGVTEMWYFTLTRADQDSDARRSQRRRAARIFGPAGMLEQDDGENWDQSTRATQGAVTRRFALNYQMGLGHGVIVPDEEGAPHITFHINENLQIWQYQAWAELMDAASWADWTRNHSRPEDVALL